LNIHVTGVMGFNTLNVALMMISLIVCVAEEISRWQFGICSWSKLDIKFY